MSVPNTDSFSLQDVVDEIANFQDDLVECFAEANSAGFNPTYGSISDNDLLAFRDYDDSGGVTYYSQTLGNGTTSTNACNDYVFSPSTYYTNTSTFSSATQLYTNTSGTSAPSGWYSDGSIARFWGGSSFGSQTSCSL